MKANKTTIPRKAIAKAHSRARKFKMPDIRHIVVHSTDTPPHTSVQELDNIPYQYVITKGGKALKFKEIARNNKTIDIAYLGGMDRKGNRCDTRTAVQNESMFRVLVQLTELFPKATIIGADELYVYSHANPGFDMKHWLNNYIPEFLQAA
jgi:hypothetical protein